MYGRWVFLGKLGIVGAGASDSGTCRGMCSTMNVNGPKKAAAGAGRTSVPLVSSIEWDKGT